MNVYAGKDAQQVSDIPVGEHWAIIENRFIPVPGDERSRSAPGHGYPEHREYFVDYRAFKEEAAFMAELARMLQAHDASPDFAHSIIGIHVAEVFRGVTTVEVVGKK